MSTPCARGGRRSEPSVSYGCRRGPHGVCLLLRGCHLAAPVLRRHVTEGIEITVTEVQQSGQVRKAHVNDAERIRVKSDGDRFRLHLLTYWLYTIPEAWSSDIFDQGSGIITKLQLNRRIEIWKSPGIWQKLSDREFPAPQTRWPPLNLLKANFRI